MGLTGLQGISGVLGADRLPLWQGWSWRLCRPPASIL